MKAKYKSAWYSPAFEANRGSSEKSFTIQRLPKKTKPPEKSGGWIVLLSLEPALKQQAGILPGSKGVEGTP